MVHNSKQTINAYMRIRITAFVGMLFFSTFTPKIQAQATAFSYQGRVLDNGANFTGAP
jgi:hypothetical protein